MKSIPITSITIDLPLYPRLLRKFRGAVIESVMQYKQVFEAAGVNTEVFHNHKEQVAVGAGEDDTADSPDRYFHYPLVQYKIKHRKVGILGMGAGAQAVQLWLSLVGEEMQVDGKQVPLKVEYHHHTHWKPALLDEIHYYRVNKWLPLSKANYDQWQGYPKLEDRVKQLNKILWGHIRHLGEGLQIDLPKEGLELYLSTIDMQTFKDCFGIQKLALDITIGTSLNLPEEIGLGQVVSIGFGKVQPIRKK